METEKSIVPIVEGQSEVESVPILLRRLLQETGSYEIGVARPFRVKRYQVVRQGELERTIEQALRDRENAKALIIILDADDDCPAELGPGLLERAQNTTNLPVAVVIAKRELEAWFLGAKESLRGVRGIRQDAVNPENPEDIRDAKGCLEENMQGRRYLEVDDQPSLAENMDFEMACKRCPSFQKFIRDFGSLVTEMS